MRLADGRRQQRVVQCVAAQGGGEIDELRGGGGPQRAWRSGEHLVRVRARVRVKVKARVGGNVGLGLGLGLVIGLGIGSG